MLSHAFRASRGSNVHRIRSIPWSSACARCANLRAAPTPRCRLSGTEASMCECTCRPPSSTPAHPRTNPTSRSPSIAPHETLPLAAKARTTSRSRCWPPHVRSITSLIRSASSTVTSGSSVTPAALAVSRASVQGSVTVVEPSNVEARAEGAGLVRRTGGRRLGSAAGRRRELLPLDVVEVGSLLPLPEHHHGADRRQDRGDLEQLAEESTFLLCGLVAHRGPPSGYQRTCVRLRVRRDGQPSIDAVGRYPDGRAAGVPRVSGPGWT